MKPEVIQMRVVKRLPPNIDAIAAVFPRARGFGILFAYGDTIYNPSGVEVPPHLAAHEHVHLKQQAEAGVENWWDEYLNNKQFRLAQELPAHQVEYEQWCLENPSSRPMRRIGLKAMANRLSGPLYNHMLSFEQARFMIKKGAPDA